MIAVAPGTNTINVSFTFQENRTPHAMVCDPAVLQRLLFLEGRVRKDGSGAMSLASALAQGNGFAFKVETQSIRRKGWPQRRHTATTVTAARRLVH
jgi:hypothetical protein